MAPVFFVLALLLPSGFASTTGKCVDITLPGILDIGECLGTSLDVCSANDIEVSEAFENLGSCLLNTLLTTDITGGVTAFFKLASVVIYYVLPKQRADSLREDLINRLTPLCTAANKPGCAKLLSGNETCKEPINISLPDTLNVSKCINESFMFCENGNLTSDSQVQTVINATACILETLLIVRPATKLNTLGCSMAKFLRNDTAIAFVGDFLYLVLGCKDS